MRLWSLHPSLLDARGLVALWREALLAQRVLQGKTRGCRSHPQLLRFRQARKPLAALAAFLWGVHEEANRLRYAFDASRIAGKRRPLALPVTQGQLALEWQHLQAKLRRRDPEHLSRVGDILEVVSHPLFVVVAGEVESWERGNVSG
jgi:hypothetical protein